MAYIEVWKSGKLVARRRVDEQKAREGCKVRLGSLGQVCVAIGKSETLGEFEVHVFEGDPPQAEAEAKETASIGPSNDQSLPPVSMVSPNAAEPMDTVPEIEGYKIIKCLGRGGMGTVWLAEQLSTKRQVALKLMVSHVIDSQKIQARFQREVELTARLDHPNIARIYDSGLHHSMYYYAMELIDGVPLDKYVKDYKLTQTQILVLMRTVCQALLYAHLRGVIHRDLKPSNIMVSPDGQPHVLDFGLAKALLEDDESLAISIEGQIAGTPAYMSPEQAAGHHRDLDTRTDVFSLGVMLYELLTGQSPFDLSGSVFEILHQITEGKIKRPSQIDKTIDLELEAVLLKAIALNPEDRYASAGAIGKDIGNYLDGEPLDARVPTILYFIKKKAWKYRSHVGITAAVLVVILGTIIMAYTKIVGQRAISRSQEQRNKLLESELVDLRAKIQSGDKVVAEAALSVLEDKYRLYKQQADEFQKLNQELNQELNQTKVPVRTKRISLSQGEPFSPTALVRQPALPEGVKSWTLETTGHREPVCKVAFSPNGHWLASGSGDGTVRFWDARSWQPLYKRQICEISYRGCIALSWSPDSHLLAIGSDYKSVVMILDSDSGTILDIIQLDNGQKPVAFSSNGNYLATGGSNGSLHIWNVRSKPYELLRSINAHANNLSDIVWLPDSRMLLTTGYDNVIKLLDSETGETIRSFEGHNEPVICITLSPDGTKFISGSKDDTYRLWDVRSSLSGRVLIDSSNVENIVYHDVTWSPDGATIVSGSSIGDIYLWDSQTGKLLKSFSSCCGDVNSIDFSPDGRLLVCGGSNCAAQVFDTQKDYQPYVVLFPLSDSGEPGIAINPQGDYRGPPGVEEQLVCVVQTENDKEVLTPKVFANKYGWVNEPWQVGLYQPGVEELKRIYVNADAQGPYDGNNWETALNDLQNALNIAHPGTEIWITAGVYKPDRGTGAREASFQLRNGISLYGGFSGNEISRYECDPNVNRTILSGDLKGDDGPDCTNNDENSYHVVDASGTDETVLLDGFIISGGNADGPGPVRPDNENVTGGGMYNNRGGLIIRNCIFRENSAKAAGGGILNIGTRKSLTVSDCNFIKNVVTEEGGNGGGICNLYSVYCIISNCTFVDNSANCGAGISNNGAEEVRVTKCKFTNNSAIVGGGVWNQSCAELVFIGCRFKGNFAGGAGGGMCNNRSSPLLIDCTYIENSQKRRPYGDTPGGGGLYNGDQSRPMLINCKFMKNSADAGGGMFNHRDGSPTLANCIFSGNVAGYGGAMWNYLSSSNPDFNYTHLNNPVMINCTLSSNKADVVGGGILEDKESSSTLTNCVLWGNGDSGGMDESAQIDNTRSDQRLSINYCCIQGWSGNLSGIGNFNTNPQFIDPNGPDGKIGSEDDNLRLSPNSSCLNLGDNSTLSADTADLDKDGDVNEPIPFDIEGKPRIVDDRVDLGAYEGN